MVIITANKINCTAFPLDFKRFTDNHCVLIRNADISAVTWWLLFLSMSLTPPRRLLSDMPPLVPPPMAAARPPMTLVDKNTSIEKLENPWVEEKDPKGPQFFLSKYPNRILHLLSSINIWIGLGSQLTYWWNKDTNETTTLGAPKPGHWIEVRWY